MDVPIKRVSELFNIDFVVVSQVNPHVVPFLDDGYVHRTTALPVHSVNLFDSFGSHFPLLFSSVRLEVYSTAYKTDPGRLVKKSCCRFFNKFVLTLT